MRLTLASIGFPLRMNISADGVSATSMRGLEPSNRRVSIGSLLESSWRSFSTSFSFRKCLFVVFGIVEYLGQ